MFGCQADVVVRMFFHMFEKHLLHKHVVQKQINVKRAGAVTLEWINQLKNISLQFSLHSQSTSFQVRLYWVQLPLHSCLCQLLRGFSLLISTSMHDSLGHSWKMSKLAKIGADMHSKKVSKEINCSASTTHAYLRLMLPAVQLVPLIKAEEDIEHGTMCI